MSVRSSSLARLPLAAAVALSLAGLVAACTDTFSNPLNVYDGDAAVETEDTGAPVTSDAGEDGSVGDAGSTDAGDAGHVTETDAGDAGHTDAGDAGEELDGALDGAVDGAVDGSDAG